MIVEILNNQNNIDMLKGNDNANSGFPVMLVLFIAIIVLMFVSISTQSKFRKINLKWAKVRNSSGKTGAQIAQELLAKNNILNVQVILGNKEGIDHYNPKTNKITLSPSTYQSASVAAQAIAAHECGHALQWAKQELSIRARDTLAPAVGIVQKIGSSMMNLAFFFLFFGMIFGSKNSAFGHMQQDQQITWFGIYLYSAVSVYGAVALFQLVTLPVEFGASRKAKVQLTELGCIDSKNEQGTKEVLTAAAMTYVVAFLMSLTIFAFFLLKILSRR